MENEKPVVLVTGSSGLIGAAVVRRLAKSFRVVGLDAEGPPHPPTEAECVCVDLTSDSSVKQALDRVRTGYGSRIESVIHLAAYYDFSGRPSAKYDEVTVGGTRRLIGALRDFSVGQFVFSSTILVHRPCAPGERINEDWPLEPRWPYPESKVKTEKLLLAGHGDIPSVILRIAGVYDDNGHSIPLTHQIQHIYERWALSHFFPGDPSHGQGFVHLEDVVDAVELTIARRGRLPRELTLLIGEPETAGYGELQDLIARELYGGPWTTRRIPKRLAQGGAWARSHLPFREEPLIQPRVIPFADDHYALDIGRARKYLEWEPKHNVRKSIPLMIAALKADPVAWYRENKIEPPRRLRREKALAGS